MKLVYIAIASLGLLSGCAFYQGMQEQPASAPKQTRSDAQTEATANQLAKVQNKAASTAAKAISPVTQY